MPGVSRYGLNALKKHLEPLVAKGLSSILIFGVVDKIPKDNTGSGADSKENPVVRGLPLIRKWFPDLLLCCDVCLCPYTDHGHCGVIIGEDIDNEASIQRIAEISLVYAKAGAHIVAPSDMMDNRILVIKNILLENKLEKKVSVLSYSVKFASNFYGPFRSAVGCGTSFGDRKCYQLPIGSKGLAARAAARDVEEGADMLMVKPGLAYLDIVKQTKDQFPDLPLFVYQVSGEYSMIVNSVNCGSLELEPILSEILMSMRRAGADVIISYFVPTILEMISRN